MTASANVVTHPSRQGLIMSTRRRFFLTAASVFSVALLGKSEVAFAQSWPTRPVKFVVSLGPGSGADISARVIADRLAARWGQPVFIENRPGGDAVVAINAVIAAGDDHVLLYAPTSSLTAHPYQHDKLPYDPGGLAPIARVYQALQAFVVSPSLGVGSVSELIALIRAQPGKLNYSTGTGMSDLIY